MKLEYFLISSFLSCVDAHGRFAVPKLVGGRQVFQEIGIRQQQPDVSQPLEGSLTLEPDEVQAQDMEGQIMSTRCGPTYGSCPSTQCCSLMG